jgi:transposase
MSNRIEKKIENILKEYQMYLSEDQLRRGLGNQIRKSDLKRILNDLEDSNKITYKKGSIVWTFADNS